MTDIFISARRGAGAPAEILYGTVTFKPTLAHSRSTSIVLPAPTTFDLVDGEVVATNVQPTPEPVEGKIEWAYEVAFKDRYDKTYSFIVGVPDSTTQVNFTSLPRYFETAPPLFGQGPKGEPGEAATVDVGTVTGGTTAQVTNSGTNTDAVLDFVLPQGPQGPPGTGTFFKDSLFSDLPNSYSTGITFGTATTANGWPESFVLVTTEKRYNGRTVQRLVDINNSYIKQRTELGGANANTWGPLKTVAWDTLATTTANGLMSSADKTRLDNFGSLPIRSKTATDAPSTYPSGTSVVNVDSTSGWPEIPAGFQGVVQVTTHKTKDRPGGTLQWVNSFTNAESGVMFRTALDNDTWGSFRKLAVDDGTIARKGDAGILASDHGANADGVTNDRHRIMEALTVANGRDVILEGGKTYLITGSITVPVGQDSVSIKSNSATPAILKLGGDGQSLPAIQLGYTNVVASTTLTTSIPIGTRGWNVASTSGIVPGMICEVMSSKSWYFDPRPETSDARKSELHKVKKVEGGKVHFYDQSNDGYDIASETVTLSFFKPIKVRLENIHVLGTHLPYAEETKAVIGLEIIHADTPELKNVVVENCARTGIRLFTCYAPKVYGGYTKGANNYWNGYGISIDGCAEALVRDHATYECRRAIDVTGMHIISRNTVLDSCLASGGGINSRGNYYGWNPDGTIGTYQGGFGSHGGSDQSTYVNCTTVGLSTPYIARGRDVSIVNMRHIGNTSGPVVACSTGINLYISGGVVTSGYWGLKHSQTHQSGNYATMISKRPEYLVRLYPEYQMNELSGSRGRVIIKGVTAELKNRAVYFDTVVPQGHFTVADNDFHFAADPGSDDASLLFMAGTPPTSGKSNWFIGPNRMTRDNGPGGVKISHNLPMTGANILNYTVSP